jgi:hypothetical protein
MRSIVLDTAQADRLRRSARATPGMHWARFGDRELVWSDDPGDALDAAGIRGAAEAAEPVRGRLFLVGQVGRSFQNEHPDVRVVLQKGRYLVVDLTADQVAALGADREICWMVRPLPVDRIVVDRPTPRADPPIPWVAALVGAVGRDTYQAALEAICSQTTRHSLSTGFTAAANWCANTLRASGYAAATVPITVGAGSSLNVVADRPGAGQGTRDLVIVTAHLDSINIPGGPTAPAPGVDDNGSGSAGVLEIARVLAAHPSEADLRFILFGGEEQGLHGSTQYVAALPAAERARVKAVVNMDMIATLNTASPTVLLEGAAVSAEVMDVLAGAAATYTGLIVETSLNPFASDHVPFINAGMPALLTIEGADSANGNVHSDQDTFAHIDYGLALEILRMNVGALARLVGTAAATQAPRGRSGPVVASAPGNLDVFVIGTDGAVYRKYWHPVS